MAMYCITAARPKGAAQHLKSEFKTWKARDENGERTWTLEGWKRAAEIAALLDAGNQVQTAKENDKSITSGAAVELELRIAKNESSFRISDMPEK